MVLQVGDRNSSRAEQCLPDAPSFRSGGFPSSGKDAPSYWGGKIHQDRLAAALRFSAEGNRVLDLGCGRGAYVQALTENKREPIGIDLQDYPEWERFPEGTFRVGKAIDLPFPDNAFDITIAFEVLEHCKDPAAVLAEIARCTKQTLVLTVPDCNLETRLRNYNLVAAHWTDQTHCNFFVKESLRELLEACGYDIALLTGSLPISPSKYFWESLRAPRVITKPLRKLCDRLQLVETYWSSILVVAHTPGSRRS